MRGFFMAAPPGARRHGTARTEKPRRSGAFRGGHGGAGQSPSVSSEALPPAAVVLTVMVFSVVKRGR